MNFNLLLSVFLCCLFVIFILFLHYGCFLPCSWWIKNKIYRVGHSKRESKTETERWRNKWMDTTLIIISVILLCYCSLGNYLYIYSIHNMIFMESSLGQPGAFYAVCFRYWSPTNLEIPKLHIPRLLLWCDKESQPTISLDMHSHWHA